MRAHEFLKESITADLYHGTGIDQAERIVKSNAMYSNIDGKSHKNEPTISFTRDFGTAMQFSDGAEDDKVSVILVFDWNKLKMKAGKRLQPGEMMYGWPGNDFGGDEAENFTDTADAIANKYSQPMTEDKTEFEEVLWSNTLPNVDNYLKQIIIMLPGTFNTEEFKSKYPNLFGNRKTVVKLKSGNYTGNKFPDDYDVPNHKITHRQFSKYSKDLK